MADKLLVVFLKYPAAGHVKQRLAAAIGDHEAARLYRAMAEAVLGAVAAPAKDAVYETAAAYWPPEAMAAVRDWLGPEIRLMPQSGCDLGQRITEAFSTGFTLGHKRVIIIGSDCPSVTADLIEDAFEHLNSCDAVVGPAADGGYYLIGLKGNAPDLFSGITWSTGQVLTETVEKCRSLNLSRVMLPELRDIDTAEDLAYYRRKGILTCSPPLNA